MNMEEVKNMIISDGVAYTGAVESDGYMNVPHGVGIMKYSDHNELGVFQDGELNGIGYLNYHDWMYVGKVSNGTINGWGLKVDKGVISFGVFEESNLKVNLTPLVEIFWAKILEEANHIGKSAVSVLKKGEVFVGVPQHFLSGKFGFHFLGNGEVFLGMCEYDQKERTGYFMHFDLDYNITKGEYKDGVLVREIEDKEYISKCEVFINHAYLDFDITMNFNPDSFLLKQRVVMNIFEIGKTPYNLIVKANIGTIRGNRFEAPNHDCDSTVWFMFPLNDDIEEELTDLMNDDTQPWAPDFSDYRVEFVNNLRNSNTNHLTVYKHVSCWDEDAHYDLDIFYDVDSSEFGISQEEEDESSFGPLISLIPDFDVKKSQLEDQWRSGGWYYTYPSLRDYVDSLATDDDVENFFGWLFNDFRFNNCSIWSLPYNYRQAYDQFLDLFPDLD
jgi:hypothetical protein